MYFKSILFCMTVFFVFNTHSQNINITGTVTGKNNQLIEGANVILVNQNLSTITDVNGQYTIAYTSIKDNVFENSTFTVPRFKRSTISFSIIKVNQHVRIDVFGINGKRVNTVVNRQLTCGEYVFPIFEKYVSSQMYLISFQVNGAVYKYKYLHIPEMNENSVGLGFPKGFTGKDVKVVARLEKSTLPDTIKVTKTGYAGTWKAIDSYQGIHNFTIDTLDSVCATISVSVLEDSTHIPISNADVVIFNSNTNQGIARQFTDSAGNCFFYVQPNLPYYLKVAAQNYKSSPPPNGASIPFQVGDSGSYNHQNIVLKKDPLALNCGTISGVVKSTTNDFVSGCLVIAIRETDSITASGFSGPDGFYILFNVPEGVYEMQCFLAGWYQSTAVTSVGVTSQTITPDVNIQLTANAGSPLSGRITFLASQNGIVDITLAHPISYEAIPGLDTLMQPTSTYSMNGIPPGTYIPWASYRNDGYVMDPDWIQKFGLPVLTFALGDSAKTLDFSITDAVPIVSPTNHKDTLVPVNIFTDTPTFVWEKYPSTQEYIIAVYNSYGDLVWGGYDSDNNVLHAKIDAQTTSVVFNFDNSANEPIKGGCSYRWKIWADKDGADGVQQFISSSEDLLGLFCYPATKGE